MFSLLFPGQGSQIVGMGKDFYTKFNYIKEYFDQADEILGKKLSKIILEGPKDELERTENTQPSIFLVSYSIFQVIKRETDFDFKSAKYYAGHSLGEYSALCCAESLTFDQTINLLKQRGTAMQNAIPKGQGGGSNWVDMGEINQILEVNKNKFTCYIANDNSVGQVVISGKQTLLNYYALN